MTAEPYPTDAEIEAVALGLLDQTLPKSQWTHAAHFAAVLWLTQRRPDLILTRDLPTIIRSFNEAVGGVNTDVEGYHETITQASIRAACSFLQTRPSQEPLHKTLAALMRSPLGRSDWVLTHWSRALLFSVAARRSWREPDLTPL
jgi:hypothetical protein